MMSAQSAQENGVHELGGEGELDDPAEVLTINPDDFPGIEGMWGDALSYPGKREGYLPIDMGRAVRRARYQLEAHPEAFQDVVKVIAKITSSGKSVTCNDNEEIIRYTSACQKTYKEWLEGKEVACPLTRAEMVGSRFCHPRGCTLPDVMDKLRFMGFLQLFVSRPLTRFGRFEVDGITSRRKTPRERLGIGKGANEGAFNDIRSILFDRSDSGEKATGKRANSRNQTSRMSKDPKAGSGRSYRKRDKLQRRLDKLKREKKKLKREKKKLKREKKELKLKRQNDKLKRENDKLRHKDTDLERENDEFEGGRSERKRKSSDLDRELSELESTLKRRASALDSTFTELESKASLLQSKFDQLRQ